MDEDEIWAGDVIHFDELDFIGPTTGTATVTEVDMNERTVTVSSGWFNEPVILGEEHGVTFGSPASYDMSSSSSLTIEMLYDTMYKMTGDPKYKREEKCRVVFEDVKGKLP